MRSWTISGGSGSTGTRGPTSAARTGRTGSPSGCRLYAAQAERLIDAGQAYYCFCTPEELETARTRALIEGRPAGYAGTCRSLSPEEVARRRAAGERAVVRFRVPDGREIVFHDLVRGAIHFDTAVIGDPVLLRSDGYPRTTSPS